MIRFDDLALFVRTAALGSFSAVAREVDLLPGQVAAAIGRLERELDSRLFARSTRSLRLTPEGAEYLPYAQEVLETLREGRDSLRQESEQLKGTLQVAAPSDFGRNILLPWLAQFRRLHPRLNLRLFLSDQLSDIFRDPIDVAIRYGDMEDASFVALPLAPDNRRMLVASPDYIARHGQPATLEQLSAICSTSACTTNGCFRWPAAAAASPSAAPWSATMPMWCAGGRWLARASPISHGSMSAPTSAPDGCGYCCPTVRDS